MGDTNLPSPSPKRLNGIFTSHFWENCSTECVLFYIKVDKINYLLQLWFWMNMTVALFFECSWLYVHVKASWIGIINRLGHARLEQLYARDGQIHFNAEGGTSAHKHKQDHQAWEGPHPLSGCDDLASENDARDFICNSQSLALFHHNLSCIFEYPYHSTLLQIHLTLSHPHHHSLFTAPRRSSVFPEQLCTVRIQSCTSSGCESVLTCRDACSQLLIQKAKDPQGSVHTGEGVWVVAQKPC